MSDNPDEAWDSIVANFGDRVELPEEDLLPREPEPEREFFTPFHSEEGYTPPAADHVGLADGARGAAWLGAIGGPAVFLIAVMTGITMPSWIAIAIVVAFLVSLGYLIATMRHHDDDPWDDGARV